MPLDLQTRLKSQWALVLAVAVGAFATWFAFRYARQPILEQDAFRQTLTALTSYWMIEEGWSFSYQTPVVGYPWKLPFEFPLYQSVVALVAWAGQWPLEPVGRLVSFGFLLGCAWPAAAIATRLKVPRETTWIFCALVWSSPLYLFWGRTFLIETTAVFFTLAAMAFALDLREPFPRWQSAFAFALFASLAMLQKNVTAAPALMVMALVAIGTHVRRDARFSWRQIPVLAVFLVPVAIGLAWTWYTDSIKAGHFFGRLWTSREALALYVGSFSDRLDLKAARDLILERIVAQNAGGIIGMMVVAAGLLVAERRTRGIIAICIVLFFVPITLFFPQHVKWDYYPASCVVFLLGAIALSLVALGRKGGSAHVLVLIATTLIVGLNSWHFRIGYWNDATRNISAESSNRTLLVADAIRRHTPQDSAIVVFGLSWSSEVAFYSQRKALTVEEPLEAYIEQQNFRNLLGGKQLGAIAFLSSRNRERYNRIVQKYSDESTSGLFDGGGWYIWLPNVASLRLADGRQLFPVDQIN